MMLENSVRRRSMSDLWMAKTSTSWSPSLSSPIRSGWNSSSGARNRAGPTFGTQDEVGPASSSPGVTTLPRPAWTYVERAAVWQGVLHLLCLQGLILLRVDGQVAGPLQWAETGPSGGGHRDSHAQDSTSCWVRPPPLPPLPAPRHLFDGPDDLKLS